MLFINVARFTHEKIVMALLGRHVTVVHVSTDFYHFSCLGCILRYTRGYCIIYYWQAFVSFGVFCSRNSSLVIPGDPCPFKRILGHELQLASALRLFDCPFWLTFVDVTFDHAFVFIQRRCIWSIVYHITRLIVYSGGFSLPIAFLFGRDDTILIISRYHRWLWISPALWYLAFVPCRWNLRISFWFVRFIANVLDLP